MRAPFDASDLRVYEAHSMADGLGEGDGSVSAVALKYYHPGPLPHQRLSGMRRRGLLTYEGDDWRLTQRGIELAEAYGRTRPDPADIPF
jgi:DNA-binding IclR family transcriptional regulator